MRIIGGQVFDLEKGFVERDLCTEGMYISENSGDDTVIDAAFRYRQAHHRAVFHAEEAVIVGHTGAGLVQSGEVYLSVFHRKIADAVTSLGNQTNRCAALRDKVNARLRISAPIGSGGIVKS